MCSFILLRNLVQLKKGVGIFHLFLEEIKPIQQQSGSAVLLSSFGSALTKLRRYQRFHTSPHLVSLLLVVRDIVSKM